LVSQDRFREDLYFRLNVIPVMLPPLRQRGEDIPILIEHFLKKFNKENRRSVTLDKSALEVFLGYNWPGNVRELENTIERLVIMSPSEKISAPDLPVSLSIRRPEDNKGGSIISTNIQEIEKSNIINALEKTGWVQAKAARLIGITPRQIGYKMVIQKREVVI
jgi:Nif-specific regulatory protein